MSPPLDALDSDWSTKKLMEQPLDLGKVTWIKSKNDNLSIITIFCSAINRRDV